MFNLVYKSVVVECSTGVEDLAKAIEKKSEEMLNKRSCYCIAWQRQRLCSLHRIQRQKKLSERKP